MNIRYPIMPLRVKCDSCKKTLSVKEHLAGKKIKCPGCQSVVLVTATAPTKASAGMGPAKADPKKPTTPNPNKPSPETKPESPAHLPDGASVGNGKPVDAAPAELPQEDVEDEALAAFADEPKPDEEAEPQFIEFKCDYCDEMVKLPIELAGKQSQCPNPECKRIVKVPLPKKAEKKDWRKMDRKGPAAALINQPEQLDDAWGTQDATKAKQSSLKEAGAIEEPPEPSIGAAGWIARGIYGVIGLAILIGLGIAGSRLFQTKQHHRALEEAKQLVEGRDAKIKTPLLASLGHRAIAILYLREGKAIKAKEHFRGALSLADLSKLDDKNAAVNEQLSLVDLALAQIELGGEGDDLLTKARVDWESVRKELVLTLQKIRTPDVQVIALREVSARLFEKKQAELAIGLTASMSASEAGDKGRPPAFRQHIANLCALKKEKDLDRIKRPTGKEPADSNARVGFAEGRARQGDFDAALAMAQHPGSNKDKLDAFFGVAAVALLKGNKDEAGRFAKEALGMAKDKEVREWQLLQVVSIAARADSAAAVAEIAKNLSPAFKLRAQLEIFLATCEKASGEIPVDAMADLEATDKEGTTLALAWVAAAKRNAVNGASRDRTRRLFEDRVASANLPAALAERIRPMVDIGWYLGSTN